MTINCDWDLVTDRFADSFDYCFNFFTVSEIKGGSRRIKWREFQSAPTIFNALYSRLRPRFWCAPANPAVNLHLVPVHAA